MTINWFKFAAPANFYPLAGRTIPVFAVLALVICAVALYWGFFETPDRLGGNNPQKEYYRIIFVHVASAWMAMWLYVVLAAWSAVGLVFNTRLSFMMAKATAPTGAMFTLVSLWTGAIWGKTSWGTWWDWDPRLTSQLILFFLYLGYMALNAAIEEPKRSDKASALLAMVGLVCVPVIYWAVNCPDPNQCAALHQRSSLSNIDGNILFSMLFMTLGLWMYSFATIFARVRSIILEREADARWAREVLAGEGRS
ncbi:MAG: cytochrome c biogenesis protein CcsA [Gammaproteobacteria bacterium]